jgi:hypothetical protein
MVSFGSSCLPRLKTDIRTRELTVGSTRRVLSIGPPGRAVNPLYWLRLASAAGSPSFQPRPVRSAGSGTRVEKVSDERLRIPGDLTIRGVTREVVLDVGHSGRTRDPWGNERAGFEAASSIDSGDFGLTQNQPLEAGGVVVGHRVGIAIEVEAVKQTATRVA